MEDKIAQEIFDKHIGSNQELRYKPITNEDVMDCIKEALKYKKEIMELPQELKDQIWEYARLNSITNIDEFTIKLVKSGLTIEQFGSTPQVQTKEKIVEIEKIVEVEKIVEKLVANEEGLTELNKQIQTKDDLIVELNKRIEKLKLTQRKDIYDED